MATAKLPSRNVILIFILGIGLSVFALLSIFPNYIAYRNITREIETLKGRIEEQKILSPIFNDLSKKAEFKEPANLPFPKKDKLARNETGKISTVIRDIVRNNGLNLEGIATDVDSLTKESGILKLNVQMSGDFMNLRNVMLQLGSLPYLEHVESIHIDTTGKGGNMRLKLCFSQQ